MFTKCLAIACRMPFEFSLFNLNYQNNTVIVLESRSKGIGAMQVLRNAMGVGRGGVNFPR